MSNKFKQEIENLIADALSGALYSSGAFVVNHCVVRDPVLKEDILAYGVYNTTTGVREAEARRITNARTLCDNFAASEEQTPKQASFDFGETETVQ